jgi:hypothetical protein
MANLKKPVRPYAGHNRDSAGVYSVV